MMLCLAIESKRVDPATSAGVLPNCASCHFLSLPVALSLLVASCRFLSLLVASQQFHRSLVLSTLSFRLTPPTFIVRSRRPKTPLTSTASLGSRDSNTQRALSHTLTSRFSTHHDHEAARNHLFRQPWQTLPPTLRAQSRAREPTELSAPDNPLLLVRSVAQPVHHSCHSSSSPAPVPE